MAAPSPSDFATAIGYIVTALAALGAWINAHRTKKTVETPADSNGTLGDAVDRIEQTVDALRKENESWAENLTEHIVDHDNRVLALLEQHIGGHAHG